MIRKVADAGVLEPLANFCQLLGSHAKGTDSLHGGSTPVFCAAELEILDVRPCLRGEEPNGFHGIFVLLVKSEMAILAAELVPTLSPLDTSFRCTTALSIFGVGRGCHESDDAVVGSRCFNLAMEDATDGTMRCRTCLSIRDCRSRDLLEVAGLPIWVFEDILKERDDPGNQVDPEYVIQSLAIRVGYLQGILAFGQYSHLKVIDPRPLQSLLRPLHWLGPSHRVDGSPMPEGQRWLLPAAVRI